MIYDCFTFFNELDLLEIRLNVLNDVVDKFVLVEMNKTHTGQENPLYFEQNKERFVGFIDKIIHVKVTEAPELDGAQQDKYGNKWLLENFQRDKIMSGLVGALPDDIIIVSDLDELPNPDTIREYKEQKANGIWVLEQKLMYYFLNNICATSPIWKNGSRMGRYADLLDPKQDLKAKEFYQFSRKGMPTYFRFCSGKYVKDAGWHFSFLGGLEAIMKKRQAIVEQQFNTEENMTYEYLKNTIESGKDIYGRKHMYIAVDVDNSFPKYILDNQDKYEHLIFAIDDNYRKRMKMVQYKIMLRNIFRRPRTLVEMSIKFAKRWSGKLDV